MRLPELAIGSQRRGPRWAALALLMLALVSLTGCGDSNATGTPGTGPAKPEGDKPGPVPAGKEDTLARIKREGVLKWGADAEGGAPFVFRDPTDVKQVIGFEMDIMAKVGGYLGVKLERVQGEWGAPLVDNLKAGRTDLVMNGYEISDEWKKVVAFSEPYYVYEQQLTVRAGDKAKYQTLDDLKGHKIAVLNDTEAERVLQRAGFTAEQIERDTDSGTPYESLDTGRVDAVLQESIIAGYYAGSRAKLYNVPKTFSPGQYGVILRQAEASLLLEINRILGVMKKNGELAAIYEKWGILNEKQGSIGVVSPAAK